MCLYNNVLKYIAMVLTVWSLDKVSTSLGGLLGVQNLGPQLTPTESDTLWWGPALCFKKLSMHAQVWDTLAYSNNTDWESIQDEVITSFLT